MEAKKHHSFRLHGKNELVNVLLSDIYTVRTNGLKNKIILLRTGRKLEIDNYTMQEIKQIATHLLQPNQRLLLPIEVIDTKDYDHLKLFLLDKDGKPIIETITKTYRKTFNKELNQC